MSLYVRLNCNFFTHRKTARLRVTLGDDAFWIPPRLWAYAAENQPDGDFSGYTPNEIANLIGYKNDASSMLEALLQAGFMDPDPLRIHDWFEWNAYHQKYAERAKHAAEARWQKEKEKEKERSKEKDLRVPEKRGEETSIACGMLGASPPRLDEIKIQAFKIGLPEPEAEKFLNYYESNGWRVGKNPMRSWHAALSNWKLSFEKGTYEKNTRGGKPNPRNAGLVITAAEQGEKIAAYVKRQNQTPPAVS